MAWSESAQMLYTNVVSICFLSMFSSHNLRSVEIVVANLPGWVLKNGLRETWGVVSGAWMQHDDLVEAHSRSGRSDLSTVHYFRWFSLVNKSPGEFLRRDHCHWWQSAESSANLPCGFHQDRQISSLCNVVVAPPLTLQG